MKNRRTTVQLADDEQVHPATVHRWIRHGIVGRDGTRIKLNAKRIGARYFVEQADWEAFLETCNLEPAGSVA